MYLVLTSDGVVHETDDAEQFVAWLDQYGPEVADHAAPNEQWTDLSRALMRDQGGPGVGHDGLPAPGARRPR